MFKSTGGDGCCFRSFCSFSRSNGSEGDPHVLLTTSAGNIELELDKQKRQCLCKTLSIM